MTPPISHLILPVGTQVVVLTQVVGTSGQTVHPANAVGVIVQSPADDSHSYRVQFADGLIAAFSRTQLSVLSKFQEGSGPLDEYDLYRNVIYRCVVGSRAYGLDDADSDTDRRGIYLPPADRHWSLYGVPEQLENTATEEVYWEAQKFLVLALKANPNVLECLYTPIVEYAAPVARELIELRPRLLSTMIYQTYNGYVLSQFKKIQGDLRNKGEVKWKHVMHLLRLLLSGITALEEGHIPVHVGAHRERLLQIKRGEVLFDRCESWRRELHVRFDAALERSPLPPRPDYEAANAWLLRARRAMI